MRGIDLPPDTFEGLNEQEQMFAVLPYQELFWRVDMIGANQMSFSLTESMELPGILIDAIEFVQQVKAELKAEKEERGPR